MSPAHQLSPAVLAISFAAPALATDPLPLEWVDEAQRLEDIVITGERNPLDDAYRRLQELLEGGAPCLGCDAQRAIARVLPSPGFVQVNLMPERNSVERFIFEVRCMDRHPGTEYRC